jgi:hypothetical protein
MVLACRRTGQGPLLLFPRIVVTNRHVLISHDFWGRLNNVSFQKASWAARNGNKQTGKPSTSGSKAGFMGECTSCLSSFFDVRCSLFYKISSHRLLPSSPTFWMGIYFPFPSIKQGCEFHLDGSWTPVPPPIIHIFLDFGETFLVMTEDLQHN